MKKKKAAECAGSLGQILDRAGVAFGRLSDWEESKKAEEMARTAFRCFVLGEGFLFGKRTARERSDEKRAD